MDLAWDSKGMKKRCTEGRAHREAGNGWTDSYMEKLQYLRYQCVSFIQLNRKEAYYIQMIKQKGLLHTGEQGAGVYSQQLDQRDRFS